MTLAVILGLWALLGPSSLSYPYFPQTQPSQQAPDASSQQTPPKDTKPQEKPEQQQQPAETKPQEPGETQQQAQPAQEQPQQSAPPPTNPAPTQQPPEAVPEKSVPEVKPSPKPPARKNKRKTAAKKDPPANSEPKKVVVRNGGAPEPTSQLTPGMSRDQVSHSRQTITQLLASTEENLKRTTGRSLTANEQAIVDQIRAFITQANAALKAGDLQRGHNLAMKARLLSDDLLRR